LPLITGYVPRISSTNPLSITRGRVVSPGRRRRVDRRAEDNPFNQRVAVLMLAKFGRTATAGGRKAVEALGFPLFDLVLTDLQMPEMDKFQATAAIRSAEAGTACHTPIVAMTAHARKEDRDRFLEGSIDGYVSKPIQEETLQQAIEDCLLRTEVAPSSELPEVESESSMDVAAALARVDGDRQFLGEMAAIFCDEAPLLLAEVEAGIESANAEGAGKAVHSLKNWIANFVAPPAFAAVQALEAAANADDLAAARELLASLRQELRRLAPGLDRLASGAGGAEVGGGPGKNQKERSETCTH
jgi:two-component system, sensor histidine kinase and response regulator